MGVGHDWAENNADLTWVKGLTKVDTFHIAPDKGMAIYFFKSTEQAKQSLPRLKEFFDGKNLKKKLIAAYLPGTIITESDFFDLELMSSEDETGGYLTWNTFKVLKNEEKYNLTIERIYLNNAQVSNPITWNEYISKDINDHKGFLWLNQKVFSNAVIIESIDEALNIKTPKMGFPKSILVSFLKDYHKGDINLFWEDIRLNSIKRVQNYFKNLQN